MTCGRLCPLVVASLAVAVMAASVLAVGWP